METKRSKVSELFVDICRKVEYSPRPISLEFRQYLFNVVTEILFNKKLEDLKDLLGGLKRLEAFIAGKSFGTIWEKDLTRVRLYKQLAIEFIQKANEEVSEEEESVLKKISESGWNGIYNRDLFVAFRNSKISLEQIIEKLIDKEMLYRREGYLIISPRGKKYLAEKTGG